MPEQQTTEATTDTAQAAATTDTTATTEQTTEQQTTATVESIDQLPQWAQDKIAALNRENASTRVNAKQAAADEARNELLQKLGLTKDGADKPDPDALAKDLTTAREQARQTAVELAVYRAAAANKANPDALLDSASFLAKVRTLDPTGADFATQVTDAITAAVTSNPILKATQAVGASGVDLGGGTGEQGQLTASQIARMTPEQIVEADSKGLLRDYMAS